MPNVGKVPSREEIEQRAYEIYLERGGKEGNALDDWLTAEKELSESGQRGPSDLLVKRATAS